MCMHVCVYIHIDTYMYVYVYVCVYTHMYTYVCVCIYIHPDTNTNGSVFETSTLISFLGGSDSPKLAGTLSHSR